MNVLTADQAVESLLSKLNEPTEIRDATGKVIGYFTPAPGREKQLYQEAATQFDPDEMKRRKKSVEKGYTTQEVLDHLKTLETS